jgi:peroxiredoxin 2/4
MLRIGQVAPDFKASAVVSGEFKEIQLSDFKGQKVVLFFYPADFTFVCPTEIIAFQDRLAEFNDRNTVVIGASTDSKESHLAWLQMPRSEGGIHGVTYPLIADRTQAIARAYNVLLEEDGEALRGLFLIDEDGVLKHMTVNHNDLGRNVDEVLRVVDALTFVQTHQGNVCPANWHAGEQAIDKSRSKEYFQTVPN